MTIDVDKHSGLVGDAYPGWTLPFVLLADLPPPALEAGQQ